MMRARLWIALSAVVFVPTGVLFAQDAPQQRKKGFGPGPSIPGAQVTPHWFADDTRFWYRNTLKGGGKEFVLVESETGKKAPAFDHSKLAAGLSKVAGSEYTADRLPFDAIEFADEMKTLRFEAAGQKWTCDLSTYECKSVGAASKRPPAKELEPADEDPDSPEVTELQPPARQPKGRFPPDGPREVPSPDGKWVAFVKDFIVFLRPTDGGEPVQLSKAGVEGNAFGMLAWSPDSKAVVGFRIEPGDAKEVHLVESSPQGGGPSATARRGALPSPSSRSTRLHQMSRLR